MGFDEREVFFSGIRIRVYILGRLCDGESIGFDFFCQSETLFYGF